MIGKHHYLKLLNYFSLAATAASSQKSLENFPSLSKIFLNFYQLSFVQLFLNTYSTTFLELFRHICSNASLTIFRTSAEPSDINEFIIPKSLGFYLKQSML